MGLPFLLAASGTPAELTAARLAGALAVPTRGLAAVLPVADRADVLKRLTTRLDDLGRRLGWSEALGLLGAVRAVLIRIE